MCVDCCSLCVVGCCLLFVAGLLCVVNYVLCVLCCVLRCVLCVARYSSFVVCRVWYVVVRCLLLLLFVVACNVTACLSAVGLLFVCFLFCLLRCSLWIVRCVLSAVC